MKIRITENQYGQLVEQSLKEKLKRKALEALGVGWDDLKDLMERLQNPTEKDFKFLETLSSMQLKGALKLFSKSKLADEQPPTLYPVPEIGKIDKYINSCYGPRWGKMHSGVDLRTQGLSKNQPLIATCAGKVTRATEAGDCGGYVKLECNNWDAVGYCHLRVVNENLYGLTVPRGFPIGISGGGSDKEGKKEKGSGNSGGAHLHYITWSGDEKINPIHMIAGGTTIPTGSGGNSKGGFCDPKK
tara:strand:- start:14508 stop:15239 length:732 start_codon:yes stop_codon:yes gene_type:complete